MPADSPNQPVASTVTANFSLPIGSAALSASVQLPTGSTNLTQLLPIIQNLENVIIDKVSSESAASGHPVSCRAGCGACCRQLVPINLFEAEALSRWLTTLPEDQMAILRQRFHRALAALHSAGILDRILNGSWTIDEEHSTQLALDYFHAGVPCPFLDNESCSIHPIRPLICREYLVTSPPELCSDPSVNNVSGIQLPLRLSRAMFAMGKEIEQEHRGMIPLVFLLAWAESGARPGNGIAGTGPEVFKKFLDHLSRFAIPEPSRAEPASSS
jgi:Fe-S-cluster containining protein